MKDIAIYGAGGFGREVEFLIQEINLNHPQYNFIGYYDDGKTKGEMINGSPVLGGIDDLNCYNKPIGIVVAIGNPKTKKAIVEKITNPHVKHETLIHPNVRIGKSEYVSVGKGCIICASNIVTVNIEIKDFVILNLACTVGHDTIIGNYCSFMPTVNISGEVVIADEVYVGTGAKIINQLEIGEKTIVGAGAVVAKSLPAHCTAVGVPAKPIKYHENNINIEPQSTGIVTGGGNG